MCIYTYICMYIYIQYCVLFKSNIESNYPIIPLNIQVASNSRPILFTAMQATD